MSLLDQNIFESMRLILPQHRVRMEQYSKELEMEKRMQPKLSEHQYTEFSSIISEAILNQTRVKITLFNKYGDKYIVGLPFFDHGLKIQTDDGIIKVQTEFVTDVQML